MQRFIPVRDELVFDDEAKPSTRLVPYQVGMPCLHWEAVIASPDAEARVLAVIRGPRRERRADHSSRVSGSPGVTPSASAVPPLSSST